MKFKLFILKWQNRSINICIYLILILVSLILFDCCLAAGLSFTDITSSGLDSISSCTHSTVFADVTGDNLPDLYITMYWGGRDISDLFFKNMGGGNFNEEAEIRNIDDFDGGSHGACFADLDNDGDYDLVNGTTMKESSRTGDNNNIFINDGNGFFMDLTYESIDVLNSKKTTRTVITFDMENDSDLDIFTVTGYKGSEDDPDEQNEVFRNEGNMRFVAITSGALYYAPAGQGATDTDYDGDGDIDIITANRTGDLNVLQNDGNGNFECIQPSIIGIDHQAGDGITMGDIDNDGDLDMLLVSKSPESIAYLYSNIGNGTFQYSRKWSNINGYMGGFTDLDNDGDLDLIFAGNVKCYINDGSGKFSIGPSIPVQGVADPRSIAFADIDNDGDQDFAVTDKKSIGRLIRNDLESENHWLNVKLVSPQGQAGAFGAKTCIYSAGTSGGLLLGFRESRSSNGYLGQNDPVLHFGLSSDSLVDVIVTFLDGSTATHTNVMADTMITINGLTSTQVKVTIETDPAERQFSVDGAIYTGNQTFFWKENDKHSFSVDSIQIVNTGKRYVYKYCNDWNTPSYIYQVPGFDQTVTAVFDTQYQLILNSSSSGIEGGGWYNALDTAFFSATSLDVQGSIRYIFKDWTGDFSSEDTSAYIIMDSTKSITANWFIQYFLSRNADPIGGGNIESAPPGEWFEIGNLISMEAVPDTESGYVFTGWSGDLSGDKNPDTLRIEGPGNVTAHFQLKTYTLTVRVEPNGTGSVVKSPDKSIYAFGDSITLKTFPDSGYVFDHWSGDTEDTNSTILLVMKSDNDVTAHFKVEDIISPYLDSCYPFAGAVSVPRNIGIQFRVKDDGYGVDISTLNVIINETTVISDGTDQTGGSAVVIPNGSNYFIQYQPSLDFNEGRAMNVRVFCQDGASPPNSLDSLYEFIIGGSKIIETKNETVDSKGGVVKDNSTGIEITFHKNAIEDTTEIIIGFLSNPPSLPDSVKCVGFVYYFGPDGLQFNDSIVVRIPYTQADLDSAGVNSPLDLLVYCFSTATGKWSKINILYADEWSIFIKMKSFCYINLCKIISTSVEVNKYTGSLPKSFALMQNYPNPFNPETTLEYHIPKICDVMIRIFDLLGHEIKVLVNENKAPGYYSIKWNGTNNDGKIVPSGIFLMHMQAGSFSETRKLIVQR